MGGFRHLRKGKYTFQKMPPESALHGVESTHRLPHGTMATDLLERVSIGQTGLKAAGASGQTAQSLSAFR
jgi:hypothetical protein